MAEIAPVSGVMDLAPIADQSFILTRRDQYSRSAGGSVYAAELGGPVWRASYTTGPMLHRRAMALEAKLNALRGSIVPFVSWDFRAEFPAAYPDGQWPGNVIGEVSAKGDMLTKTFERKGASVNPDGAMFVTRSGMSTVWDVDGTLKTVAANNPRFMFDPSEVNYAWPSEDLTSSQWAKTRMSATLAHVWNGYQFTRLTPNSALQATHYATNDKTFSPLPYDRQAFQRVIIKSDGAQTTKLALRCWDSTGAIGYGYFDLIQGSASRSSASLDIEITDEGEGYFAAVVKHTLRAGATACGIQVYAANPTSDSVSTFDFNGTDSYLVSACQLGFGPNLYQYRKTTDGPSAKPIGLIMEPPRSNIAFPTENFSGSNWSRNAVTLGANIVDGGINFTEVIPNSTNTTHNIQRACDVSGEQSVHVAFFVRAKDYFRFSLRCADTVGLINRVAFNCQTGVATSSTGVVASMVDEGNGNYRIIASYTTRPGSTSASCQVEIANDAGMVTFSGDGVKGAWISGATFVIGSTITSYIPATNSVGTRGVESVLLYNDGGNDWTLNAEPALAHRHSTGSLNIAGYSGYLKGYEAKLTDPVQSLPGITMTGIAIDNDRVTLSGLPRGFVATDGDYLSFDYGAKPYRYLGQIIETKVASAAGVLSDVQVYPPIPTTAVFGLTVNLVKASAFFRIEPGSLKHSTQGGQFTVVSFDAVQSF